MSQTRGQIDPEGLCRAKLFDCGPQLRVLGSQRDKCVKEWRQEVARAGKSLHKVPSAHVQLTRTGAPLPGSTRAKQKNRKKKKGKGNRFGGWGTEVLARVPDGRVHGVGSECINQIGSLSQPRTTSNNVFVQLVQWFISLWLGYAGDGAARPGPQLHANENRWTRSHIH